LFRSPRRGSPGVSPRVRLSASGRRGNRPRWCYIRRHSAVRTLASGAWLAPNIALLGRYLTVSPGADEGLNAASTRQRRQGAQSTSTLPGVEVAGAGVSGDGETGRIQERQRPAWCAQPTAYKETTVPSRGSEGCPTSILPIRRSPPKCHRLPEVSTVGILRSALVGSIDGATLMGWMRLGCT